MIGRKEQYKRGEEKSIFIKSVFFMIINEKKPINTVVIWN